MSGAPGASAASGSDRLAALVGALSGALGARLVSVTLYGSHATERPCARDPIRLCIELDPCDPEALAAAGRVLGGAAQLRPYLVGRGELGRLCDVFPVKLRAMQAHHRVLHGSDPLSGARIDREHLRVGVERGLRNHLIRLRAHVALRGSDAASRQAVLWRVAEEIEDEADALVSLGGAEPMPADVAERLRALREGGAADDRLLRDVLGWLGRAVAEADRLEVA